MGALDEDEIKRRMGRLGVDPTVMLERGCTLREAERGRKRDRSRARVEEDHVNMDGTTTPIVSASDGGGDYDGLDLRWVQGEEEEDCEIRLQVGKENVHSKILIVFASQRSILQGSWR